MVELKSKDERTRNWTFILYPESSPINWRDILDEEHIQWAESPLHEFDTNPDGEIKKSHYHILLLYEGKKSFTQIRELTDRLNQPNPQKVASARGVVRYMVHMDNPEKHQYDQSKIIGHGGFDVAFFLKPTSSTRYELIREMMIFVKENDLIEIIQLLNYAMDERFDDWFPLLCDNSAYIMDAYIKSNRWRGDRDKWWEDAKQGSKGVKSENGQIS